MVKLVSCKDCAYWERDGRDGVCRRYSPRPSIVSRSSDYIVIWPRTNSMDGCSEGDLAVTEDTN